MFRDASEGQNAVPSGVYAAPFKENPWVYVVDKPEG